MYVSLTGVVLVLGGYSRSFDWRRLRVFSRTGYIRVRLHRNTRSGVALGDLDGGILVPVSD